MNRQLRLLLRSTIVGVFAAIALGVLAFATLSDQRIRLLTLLIVAMFACKTWARRKDVIHPDGDGESE